MKIGMNLSSDVRRGQIETLLSGRYQIDDHSFDVLILDVPTLRERLRYVEKLKKERSTKILLVAEESDAEWIKKQAEHLFDEVVFEPVREFEVIARIEMMKEATKQDLEAKGAEKISDFDVLFSSIGHPVIVISPEFDVLYVNRTAERMLREKGVEHVVGEKCYRVFHGRDEPLKNCPCLKLIESGKVETAEIEIDVFGGTYLVSVTPIHREGKLERMVHLAVDITDLKNAEKRLKVLYEANKLLHEIERRVLSAENLDGILKITAGKLLEFLPADAVMILSFEGGEPEVLAFAGKDLECDGRIIFDVLGESLSKVADSGEVLVESTAIKMECDGGSRPDGGIRSFVLIPIVSDGVFGSIMLISSGEEPFTEEVIQIARDVADSLALAIKSSKMRGELIESEEMFRALAEKSLVGVDIIQDGVFVYVNPKFAEMMGYSREELLGKSPLEIIHPEDRELFIRNYRDRMEGKKTEIYYTLRGVRKDGEIRHIETFGSRIMLRGKPAIVGVSIDITDRIRMQEELKRYAERLEWMVEERTRQLVESESRYRSLVESPIVGFWEADADGVFTFVNERFLEMSGYTRDEIVGKRTVFDLISPEFRPWLENGVEIMKKRRLPAGIFEVELVRKDGSRFHVIVSPCPIYDENGEHIRTVGAMIDITDRIRMERKLRQTLEELEAYAKAISHDLRAPLRGLMGYAGALIEEYYDRLDSTAQKYIQRISFLSSKMDSLINDLLEYTRVSEVERTIERVDMNEIVDYAIEMLRDEVEKRGARIHVDVLPCVMGDRKLLLSVMMNLISNAIKFVEDGVIPEIRICSTGSEGYARICVEDNGIGVPEKFRERIFHLFERLHGEEVYPGTGVGLAIVKKAVEIMGGKYGVDSKERGSIFWIELERCDSRK